MKKQKIPRSCKKCVYPKNGTVNTSKIKNHSDDNVKEKITTIYPKKLYRHLRHKRSTPVSYKESSNSEDDESVPKKINQFSKYVTACKLKSDANSEDSINEVLKVNYPKKRFSNRQITHSTDPEGKINTFSCRSTYSPKKCDARFSKYVTVGKSKRKTDYETIRVIQTKTSGKKHHVKCLVPESFKEAYDSKSAGSRDFRITKFSPQSSCSLRKRNIQFSKHPTVCKSKSGSFKELLTIISPKKQFNSQRIKHLARLSYKEASNSETETDSEINIGKIQTKTFRRKRFSKRHRKYPSYKEVSNSEDDDSPIENMATFSSRKLSNLLNINNSASNIESQTDISVASEEDVDELIGSFSKKKQWRFSKRLNDSCSKLKNESVLDKSIKQLTCKVVEEVNKDVHLNVKMKDTCTNSSKFPIVKCLKDNLKGIARKSSIKKSNVQQSSVILTPIKYKNFNNNEKEEDVLESHSNKENIRQCSVFLTPIDIKSDNNMNKCMGDQFILSKNHISEILSTKDVTDGIKKSINCYDFSSENHCRCKVTKITNGDSLQLLPCSVVLSPIHIEKCDSHTKIFESRKCSKSEEVLENITKESSNTAIQILDTNELSAKGYILDTFLQPDFVSFKKGSFSGECEIGKLKTAPLENTKLVRKQTRANLLSSLNKCNKTFVIAGKSKEFAESVMVNSFDESFNCIPCSVRLTRLSLDDFHTNVKNKTDKLCKSNINLYKFERVKGIVLGKQKKYSSALNSKGRITEKKHIACNSTDCSAGLKKNISKDSETNVLTSCNTRERGVNDDNTCFQDLKNSKIVFDNDCIKNSFFLKNTRHFNTKKHPFCNSEVQLTSGKKNSKIIPEINTLVSDNGIFDGLSAADIKLKVKPKNSESAMVTRSCRKLSKKVPSRNVYGVQSNNFELQSKTGLRKVSRCFLSKQVPKSFKNSIKKRKASQRNTRSEKLKLIRRRNIPKVRRHSSGLLKCNGNLENAAMLLLRKQPQSNFMCVQCNQSVSSSKALYEHLCLGKREKGYLCCICERIFKLNSQFKKHKKFHRSNRIALDENLLP